MSLTMSARAGSPFNCDSDTVAYLSEISMAGIFDGKRTPCMFGSANMNGPFIFVTEQSGFRAG
ncbi:hypothetical protein ACFFP0_11385 [Rhizobium puerariae]|uniref:Uncharacterized protein n=1 Tax=Rhizobium puerariae TaxID=1585791 RepID=A0ABV6AFQ3_9HYPH